METFSLIKLIMGVVFVGVMILTGINNKEPLFMVISSVLLTFGILYGIGLLPYSFFIFVVLGLMMHTYVKSASIEDTLFNVLLIITICLFLGMFGDIDFFKPFRNFKLKEGFWLLFKNKPSPRPSIRKIPKSVDANNIVSSSENPL